MYVYFTFTEVMANYVGNFLTACFSFTFFTVYLACKECCEIFLLDFTKYMEQYSIFYPPVYVDAFKDIVHFCLHYTINNNVFIEENTTISVLFV